MEIININQLTKRLSILVLLMGSLCIQQADAQRFKASTVLGFNLSQIDGDDLAGFSKVGLTGGLKLAYPLKDFVDLNFEMLYSQRGSNSGFGFGGSGNNFTDLKYIEFPLYVNIKDWYIPDDDYFKVKAHAGLSYAYLFDVNSSNGTLSGNIDNYKRNNIGYLLGLDYAFNSRFTLTFRYTRAFNTLYIVRAISYFLTIRTEYTF